MHAYMYTYNTQVFRQTCNSVKQIRPNLTKDYSQTYICADYVWNKEEKHGILCFEAGREAETKTRDRQRQETDRDRELSTQTRGIMSNKYQLLLLQGVTWHSAVNPHAEQPTDVRPEHRLWILRRHWIISNVCGPEVLRLTERLEEVPTSGRFRSVTQSLYWGCIVITGQSVAQVSLRLRSVYGSGQSVAQVSLWLRSVCGSGQSVAQVSLSSGQSVARVQALTDFVTVLT